MSKHTQHYTDLNQDKEPSGLMIWLGAALTLAAIYVVILLSVLWS